MKPFDKTQGRHSKITLLLASLLLVVGVFLAGVKLFADGGSNMYGYLWSSNIGWIDMNDCSNPADSTTCNPSGSFGVSVLPTAPGTMTGYAWSSNIGWITFNDPACPTSGCTPGASVTWNSDGSGTVHGWARACSVYDSGCSGAYKGNVSTVAQSPYLGTWDGFIALDSTTAGGSGGTWGVTITPTKTMTGNAWGSQVIGWISNFNAAIYVGGPIVVLTPNPPSISSGASSILTATAANIDGATACTITASDNSTVPKITMSGSGSSWTGNITVSPTNTTTYTISCTKGSQIAKAQATVNVTYFSSPTSPGSGGTGGSGGTNGGYCTNGDPQFSWNLDGSACTITRTTDGATQAVPCNSNDTAAVFGATLSQVTGDTRLYYTDTALPVVGNSSTYTITSDTNKTGYSVTETSCGQDFALEANPTARSFVASSDGKSMVVTYTVSVVPVSGFTSPVALTISSYPQTGTGAMPASTSFTFSNPQLVYSGGAFDTSLLTISIPLTDYTTASYSPIVIQGVGGTYTRTVQVSANATVNVPPVYKEF